jgi:hypothetical protein
MNQSFGCRIVLALLSIAAAVSPVRAADKPVFLYSQYFNAPGENRYSADGNYSQVLEALKKNYAVEVDDKPLNAANLSGTKVVLIANPNDQPHGTNAPPHHISGDDAIELYNWVQRGGGLILMGNQENHNLETRDVNQFLRLIGLKWADTYTDAKRIELPADLPILGGLTWAYYTGNQIEITPGHPSNARCLIESKAELPTLTGRRNTEGCLLAIAEVGSGRVVLVTDAGWIANWALNEEGVGGIAIKNQDNLEIFLRLTKWAAHTEE